MGKIKIGSAVDADLWRRFKAESALRGMAVVAALEEAIKLMLRRWKGETK